MRAGKADLLKHSLLTLDDKGIKIETSEEKIVIALLNGEADMRG